MTAGVPGTGIGGLFYLIIALWMPVRELFFFCIRRKVGPGRLAPVIRHAVITAWIILAMWAAGEFIGLLFTLFRMTGRNTDLFGKAGLSIAIRNSHSILHLTPFLLTLAVLIAVYLSMHALRLYVRNSDKGLRE